MMALNNWRDVEQARGRVDEAVSLAVERLEASSPRDAGEEPNVIARALLDCAVIVVSELRVLGVTVSYAIDEGLRNQR